MTMIDKQEGEPQTQEARTRRRPIALFIGAINANDHVTREELARAHHLIWSTKRFWLKSGETVGRLIDRMKGCSKSGTPRR